MAWRNPVRDRTGIGVRYVRRLNLAGVTGWPRPVVTGWRPAGDHSCAEGSRAVLRDVDHLAIRAADEEPANTPRFVREGVHHFITTSPCLLVRGIDVVDLDGHDRVLWRRCVPRHHLDARTRLRGGEAVHP